VFYDCKNVSKILYNEALIAILYILSEIGNLPLSHFGMSSPNRSASDLIDIEMNRELHYDTAETASIVTRIVPH